MIGEKKTSLARAGKFSQKRKTSTAGCPIDPLGQKNPAGLKTASTLVGGRKQPGIKVMQASAKQTTGKTRRVTATINGYQPMQTQQIQPVSYQKVNLNRKQEATMSRTKGFLSTRNNSQPTLHTLSSNASALLQSSAHFKRKASVKKIGIPANNHRSGKANGTIEHTGSNFDQRRSQGDILGKSKQQQDQQESADQVESSTDQQKEESTTSLLQRKQENTILNPQKRQLSLYLRQADQSTFYSANLMLPKQQQPAQCAYGAPAPLGLPISKNITNAISSQEPSQLYANQQSGKSHEGSLGQEEQKEESLPPTADFVFIPNDQEGGTDELQESQHSQEAGVVEPNVIVEPPSSGLKHQGYSVNISNQLEMLNTEREETEFYNNESIVSSDETIVQDVEQFLQDPILPIKCISKELPQVSQKKKPEKQKVRRDGKKKELIIGQIEQLLHQLNEKKQELNDCAESDIPLLNIETAKSRAESYLQTLTQPDLLPIRCQNPAPRIDEDTNSSFDDQKTVTERVGLENIQLRNRQVGSHLIQNYGAHMASRIGPNDRFIQSETESSFQNMSRAIDPHDTVLQIRQTSNSPFQPLGYYQQFYDIELHQIDEGSRLLQREQQQSRQEVNNQRFIDARSQIINSKLSQESSEYLLSNSEVQNLHQMQEGTYRPVQGGGGGGTNHMALLVNNFININTGGAAGAGEEILSPQFQNQRTRLLFNNSRGGQTSQQPKQQQLQRQTGSSSRHAQQMYYNTSLSRVDLARKSSSQNIILQEGGQGAREQLESGLDSEYNLNKASLNLSDYGEGLSERKI